MYCRARMASCSTALKQLFLRSTALKLPKSSRFVSFTFCSRGFETLFVNILVKRKQHPVGFY